MRHSHVLTTLHSCCWRSRIILMTLLQVTAASLLFSDTSTMTQRLRSTISTIVDSPETLFQMIPFCQTKLFHCPLHQEPAFSSSRVLLKNIDLMTSPIQCLAGVWGVATLTSFSATVSYTFFFFDLPSCFLWLVTIFHPPPLCVVLSDNVLFGKMESSGIVSLECPL